MTRRHDFAKCESQATLNGCGGGVAAMRVGYSLITSMTQDTAHDGNRTPPIRIDECSYRVCDE